MSVRIGTRIIPSIVANVAASTLTLTLGSLALSGCGAEMDEGYADEATVTAAITGSNPLVDAQYRTTITMQGSPAGVTYTDLAVSSTKIYLARSDGAVERRTLSATAPFESYLGGITAHHINYVQNGSSPTLIGANDTNRTISRNLQNVPGQMGSYPGGVGSIWQIAGRGLSGGGIRLYVIHGDQNNVLPVLRVGTWNPTYGLTWEGTTRSSGPYNTGLCIANGNLYTVVNYMSSFFSWRTIANLDSTGYEAGLAPNTEHAYLHPEGANDRFAPVGIDYNPTDDYFYGIDDFYNPNNPGAGHRWVLTRLARSNLKP